MSGLVPGRDDAPRVDVVIVSFESRDLVLAALESLERDGGVPLDVIVVDNASTDGTAAALLERQPGARVLANTTNRGFSAACNQGWRAGRAPLVLFLNPDAEVTPGTVPALVSVFDERPEVGVAGPRTHYEDGSVQVSTGRDLTLASEWRQRRLVRGVRERDPGALALADALHSREHEPDWVSGSCLMARRTALEAVGGFDEDFFLYEEDADLCRRVRAAGFRVVFTPAALVRHRLGGSMARASARARAEYDRSHLLYYRKHNGPVETALLRAWTAARRLKA